MSEIVCVNDIEQHAFQILPKNILGYYRCGAGAEQTLANNKTAFSKFRIRPKVLRDVSRRDLATMALGSKAAMPIGVAPTAMQKMAHEDGECASAKAAEAMGTVFILSTLSTTSIEEVAKAAPHATKWFQLYIYRDREVTKGLLERAEKAGFKAIILTVDCAVSGIRRAYVRNKFSLPSHLQLANFMGIESTDSNRAAKGFNVKEYVQKLFNPSLEWKDITWLQSITTLPIILKGILTAEDAIKGADLGVAAILVSNHGARQVDYVPATIEVLSEVVKAVGHKVDVFVDGGFREGTDIFKALALGAKMVFIGRPILWGLAYNGEKGVKQILQILKTELDNAFALTGCTSVKHVTPDMIVHESYYAHL